MLQFHDARSESSPQTVNVGETSRSTFPCTQRRPQPIRRAMCWIAGALLVRLLFSAEIALAAWGDSAVYYDPGSHSVSGFSQTVRDPWDEDIWNCWGGWEYQECDVTFYQGVWVDAYFDSPSGPWAYGAVADYQHALAIPPTAYSPQAGPWSVFAFHYIRWTTVTNLVCQSTPWGGFGCFCPPENNCWVDTYDQLIDVSSNGVIVPEPPCIHHGTPQDGSLSNDASLPNVGTRYYHFLGTDPPDTDDWACPDWMHAKIETAGQNWIPSPRIGVGDLSLQGGGYWGDHSSHENGLDADIRYFRLDGQEASRDLSVNPSQLDVPKTQALVNWFCNVAGASLVLVYPQSGITGSCVDPDADHYNHLHVRFPDPDGLQN